MLLSVLVFLVAAATSAQGHGSHYQREQYSNGYNIADRSIPADETPLFDNPAVTLHDFMVAIGAPRCAQKCVEPLATEARTLLSLRNLVGNFRQVCDAYANTTACNQRAQARGCWAKPILRKVYDIATAGLEVTCVTRRRAYDKVAPCLQQNGNLDNVLQSCTATCGVNDDLHMMDAFTPQNTTGLGAKLLDMLTHLGPLCEGLMCLFPCVRDQLNAVCPVAGYLVLDTLISPFEEAAKFIGQSAPIFQDVIHAKLDPKCQPLLDINTLKQLSRPRQQIN